MGWDIGSKKVHSSSFSTLRLRLLISYLMVMAAILGVFATGVYGFFSRSFYQQLNGKLRTLAQSAAPSMVDVKKYGRQYLYQVDEVPWRDIFNRDQQSLEWFDAKGKRLATRGQLSIELHPQPGPAKVYLIDQAYDVQTFTISVYRDGTELGKPILEGFIRASQSTATLEVAQTQLLWGLGMGGMVALGFAGLGGLWLTQKALEPVEQSFNQLKQFTADASHELRSPLTAIKTSVDVMRSHPERIHPKNIKKLAAIASATTQMIELLEDLLFLARTDRISANPTVEHQPIVLNQILDEVGELLELTAETKDISLTLDIPDAVTVMGNPAQLSRLFSNLIENAMQYTPQGGRIEVSLEKQHRTAIVTIQDNGIGMSGEQIPFVFDRLWRADKARSHREGGTGLGLAIAQAIAIQHGGKITVTSDIGMGSRFQVRLPISSG